MSLIRSGTLPPLQVHFLGLLECGRVIDAMKQFTHQRDATTPDAFWVVEHPSVYTQGLAGLQAHIVDSRAIPIVQTDRGGQVTYHGPGQLIVYLLVDIGRLALGVRAFVTLLEESLIATLEEFGIAAVSRSDAPGVYVGSAKIASLGLKIRRGCSYHGIALNVDMDMSPWQGINPCGLGVPMTQMSEFCQSTPTLMEVADRLIAQFVRRLGYTNVTFHQFSHLDEVHA